MSKSAIILAGGNATRFKNIDKAFLKKDGKFFIEIMLDKVKKFDEIIIVTNNFDNYKIFERDNIILTDDIVKDVGPMGGIYSGLAKTSCEESLVLSCDIPNISDSLIEFLYKLDGDYSCAVPFHSENKTEPLCGLYKKSLLPKIKKLIESKSFKLENIFGNKNSTRLIKIGKENFSDYENIIASFYNVNTREDFEKLTGGI